MAAQKVSTAADVRAWGQEQNANGSEFSIGARGRLNPALVEAFNSAHPRAKYAEGNSRPKVVTVEVEGQDSRGRKRTRKVEVNVAEARAALVNSGAEVGKRGRLPQSVLTDYAATL